MTDTISPRNNAQRATNSRLLFKLTIAFNVVSLLNTGLIMSLPANYPLEEPHGFGQIVIMLQGGLVLLQLPVQILTIVFFLQWFRRAYYNLWKIGRQPDYSDGWAVGVWFVPIVSFYRPYSIMKEIWYDTGATTSGAPNSRTVLRGWWLAYLVHVVANSLANMALRNVETMPQLLAAAPFSLFSDVADMASAAMTLLVIGCVYRAEQHWQGRAQLQSLGGPAPEPVSLLPTEEEHYG